MASNTRAYDTDSPEKYRNWKADLKGEIRALARDIREEFDLYKADLEHAEDGPVLRLVIHAEEDSDVTAADIRAFADQSPLDERKQLSGDSDHTFLEYA